MKKPITTLVLLLSCLAITPVQASWISDLFGTSAPPKTPPADTSLKAKTQSVDTPAATQDLAANPLVNMAMSQLSLDKSQAEGGLGSLLNMAKSSLSQDDFSTLAKDIPGADMLLAAAPLLKKGDGVSGLLSQAGDLGSTLKGGAMVYDAFEKLGISKDMVMPMVSLLKNYLQGNSGAQSVGLLTKGLGALL